MFVILDCEVWFEVLVNKVVLFFFIVGCCNSKGSQVLVFVRNWWVIQFVRVGVSVYEGIYIFDMVVFCSLIQWCFVLFIGKFKLRVLFEQELDYCDIVLFSSFDKRFCFGFFVVDIKVVVDFVE